MLALADDAALARLVIAATRIRTYRRGQWLRRPLPAPGSAKHRSLVGQSRRTIGSCSQTQAATVATDHHPCGTFDAYKIYARLDIIEHDGGSYIAVRDDPGTIPGEDG